MSGGSTTAVLPAAGPLITLAYADALDLLFKPGWAVEIVDMVLKELTRNSNTTPTSERIAAWVTHHKLTVLTTNVGQYYDKAIAEALPMKRSGLGELAIQEVMSGFALQTPPKTGVFLFEDHKIARASFLLPDCCRKVSTRAFLQFLEQKNWIASAVEVERCAITAGRQFSQIRFPSS
jgi:hypothetical protein